MGWQSLLYGKINLNISQINILSSEIPCQKPIALAYFFTKCILTEILSLAKNDIDRDISLGENDIDRDISFG